MVYWQQLELALESRIEEGFEDLEEVNMPGLVRQFDQVLAKLPPTEQLRVGGLYLDRLAQLYRERAMLLLDDWEEEYNTQGPRFDDSLLEGLIRETQFVDVSEFVKPGGRVRSPKVTGPLDEEDSVFVELDVEQAVTLAEQDLEQVDLSHAENVSDWVEQIKAWFEQQPYDIRFMDLHQQLKMPFVELCLGLLLGGFALEQRGDFYELSSIWVSNYDSTVGVAGLG